MDNATLANALTAASEELEMLAFFERQVPELQAVLTAIRGDTCELQGSYPFGSITLLSLLVRCGLPEPKILYYPKAAESKKQLDTFEKNVRLLGLVPRWQAPTGSVELETDVDWEMVDEHLDGMSSFASLKAYCIQNAVADWVWQGDGSGDSSNDCHWQDEPGNIQVMTMVEALENEVWEHSSVDVNNEGGYWQLIWDQASQELRLESYNYVHATEHEATITLGD